MKPTVICDVCKQAFELSSTDIRKEAALFDHKRIVLTLYTCPFCNNEYPVQLDDDRTQYLSAEYCKLAVEAVKYTGASKRYHDKLAMLSNDIDKHRKELIEKYNGKMYRSVGMKQLELKVHIVGQVY